jgi:signal transduction histidine kinase
VADKLTRCGTPDDRDKFAVSFAHEISNPVESLINLLFLVSGEATFTKKGLQYLNLMREETQRLSSIAHAALDELHGFSALRSTDVVKLVFSVLDRYRSRLAAHGITVNTRFCADSTLPAYSGLLRQSFTNLVLNAADAMPHGGTLYARVSNGREYVGLRRNGLRVTFADNGVGISDANLRRILEPYFTTKGASGNGIGLSLVNDAVLKHSGVLRIRSCTTTGRSGSVFSIFLPIS